MPFILTDPSARPVVAHRGGAGRAPENTAVALLNARSLGADAVELDVRLSRDGEVMVMHDPTVDRTTDGRGSVDAMGAAELERLDAGARFTLDGGRTFPFAETRVGVPRLDDLIPALGDMPMIIEIKVAAALGPTVRLLERHGAVDRAVVAAADHAAVDPARGGALRTGASTRDAVRLLLAPRAPAALPFQALCIPERHHGIPLPLRYLAARARRAGAMTHVWTVNDPRAARRLWQAGVAGIITDLPDLMVEERARS